MTFRNGEHKKIEALLEIALLNDAILPSELFRTLTGNSAADVSSILDQARPLDLDNVRVRRLVFDVLNNLSNFPHRQDDRILSEIGLTRDEVRDLRERIRMLGV